MLPLRGARSKPERKHWELGTRWHLTATGYSYSTDRSSLPWTGAQSRPPHETQLLQVSGWQKFWFFHELDAHICISSFCKCVISGSPSSPDQGTEEWKINQAMQNVLGTAIRSFPSHKKLSRCIYQTCHWNKKNCFNILWHLQPRVFNTYRHHRHLYRIFSHKLNYEVQMQPLCDFF